MTFTQSCSAKLLTRAFFLATVVFIGHCSFKVKFVQTYESPSDYLKTLDGDAMYLKDTLDWIRYEQAGEWSVWEGLYSPESSQATGPGCCDKPTKRGDFPQDCKCKLCGRPYSKFLYRFTIQDMIHTYTKPRIGEKKKEFIEKHTVQVKCHNSRWSKFYGAFLHFGSTDDYTAFFRASGLFIIKQYKNHELLTRCLFTGEIGKWCLCYVDETKNDRNRLHTNTIQYEVKGFGGRTRIENSALWVKHEFDRSALVNPSLLWPLELSVNLSREHCKTILGKLEDKNGRPVIIHHRGRRKTNIILWENPKHRGINDMERNAQDEETVILAFSKNGAAGVQVNSVGGVCELEAGDVITKIGGMCLLPGSKFADMTGKDQMRAIKYEISRGRKGLNVQFEVKRLQQPDWQSVYFTTEKEPGLFGKIFGKKKEQEVHKIKFFTKKDFEAFLEINEIRPERRRRMFERQWGALRKLDG